MAMLDGIQDKVSPGDPVDGNVYDATVSKGIPMTPRTLSQSLDALDEDHAYLLRGDVFSRELISTWIEYKRKHEVAPVHVRPHPFEFCLYYDV